MRQLTRFTRWLFLILIPSIVLPHDVAFLEIEKPQQQLPFSSFFNQKRPVSYDDILELIDEIETGTLSDCNDEEIENVNYLLTILAKQGILPHQEMEDAPIRLARDIETLGNDHFYFFDDDNDFFYRDCLYNPWNPYQDLEPLLCKSFAKKSWDKTRRFIKKHKKEILIGAAIVVAVAATVTVIVMTCGTASAGAALAAETIAGLSQIETDQEEKRASFEPSLPPPEQAIPSETAILTELFFLEDVIHDEILSVKETISENIICEETTFQPVESSEFVLQARAIGAHIAHETLDFVGEVFLDLPRSFEGIESLANKSFPSIVNKLSFSSPNQVDSLFPRKTVEDWQEDISRGHEWIDEVFKTNLSKHYTPEWKELEQALKPSIQYAILPPPGALSKGGVSLKEGLLTTEGRLLITECNSICGWKVGDPIQNRTWWGGRPKWSTVRQRHWKNRAFEAKSNPELYDYKKTDIERMKSGLAPQRLNKQTGKVESMELHHIPPQRDGGLFDFIEVWPEEHANLDPNRYLGK